MMDPAKKAAWVAALRSGYYPQGRDSLCYENEGKLGYCCLGVACEINGVEKVLNKFGRHHYVFAGAKHTHLPSKNLLRFWGLSYQAALDLARMNDQGKTFAEIADYIESNPNI